MAYIITKKNGKPYKWDRMRPLIRGEEVAEFARDGARLGDCWTFKSPVTMRVVKVGACRNPTPAHMWGAKKRKRRRR
jgi:hypothetical protein